MSTMAVAFWLTLDFRLLHVGFLMDKVALGQVFLQVLTAVPCHYHSSNASYSFIHLLLTPYNIKN